MGSTARHILRLSAVKALKFTTRTIFVLVVILGAATAYDSSVGDGELPSFAHLGYASANNLPRPKFAHDPDLKLIYYRRPYNETHVKNHLWEEIHDSVRILYRISPRIGTWVRQQYQNDKIVFSDGNGSFCTYDYFTGVLTLRRGFFTQNEGKKAVMLAHEYRHSRQNYGKLLRYIASHLFTSGGQESIVENDAYLYEQDAVLALFGEFRHCDK